MDNLSKLSFSLFLLLISFSIAGQTSYAQTSISGIVFEDRNENRIRDRGEPGIEGVMVSNQNNVVLTDKDGQYSLPVTDRTILFVTKPPGYRFHLNELNLPQFYYIHQPEGSPELTYSGVEPTGSAPDSVDFGLILSERKETFTVITYGDPQPRNDVELSYYRDKIVNELGTTNSDFILVLGDIMYDDLSLYDRYNQLMATLNRPVYNVYGNHDINFDADGNEFARETFKRHYGPTFYSFEEGDVHFIVLDNIDYLGYNEEGNSQYKGGISPQQITWMRNNLQHVDKKKRLVLAAHIPLHTPGLEDVDVVNTANRNELFEILDPFDDVIFLAGHMHTNFHSFLDQEFGRTNANPVHQIITSAASGSWWSGPKDENGIPVSTQRDGVPNGYHVVEFKETDYIEFFKPAGMDSSYQMRIESPAPELRLNRENTELLVNVFNGSQKSQVRYKINHSDWIKMDWLGLSVSPFFKNLLDQNSDTFASWIQPVETTHLWRADLTGILTAGTHRITVWTRDQFGQEFSRVKVIEVSN